MSGICQKRHPDHQLADAKRAPRWTWAAETIALRSRTPFIIFVNWIATVSRHLFKEFEGVLEVHVGIYGV